VPYNAFMTSANFQIARSFAPSNIPGLQVLHAHTSSREYSVFIARGLLTPSNIDRLWPFERATSRTFCVSDETVWELYGERLSEVAKAITIAPGESSKTMASAKYIWQALVEAGMTREDHLVSSPRRGRGR
jgi:3-dehydroquinate synthetase